MSRKSSSNATAIVALIIGMCGLGFGAYAIFAPPKSGIVHTWFKSDDTGVTCVGNTPVVQDSALAISYTIASSESVYVQFSGSARFQGSNPATYIYIEFAWDGVASAAPQLYLVVNPLSGFAGVVKLPATLQAVNSTAILPGPHVVTVAIYGSNLNSSIIECTLLVQTYFP